MIKWILTILLFYCCLTKVFGQDIHWSQFDYNPVFQNPANVGHYENEDYRVHMNYRDQWRSVTVPFQTFSASGEIRNAFLGNLSVGAFVMSDVVGDGRFRTVEVMPSVNWLSVLDKDSTRFLRVGGQLGMNYRQLNADAFTFDSQWSGAGFDQGLPTNELFANESNLSLNTGIGASYEWVRAPKERLVIGTGLFNINRPDNGFFGEQIQRPMRFNMFARIAYPIGFDMDVLPSLQFNVQGTYREVLVGSMARYTLVDRLGEYKAVLAGAYLRGGDAAVLTAGMEWQNWWAGISYDMNFSKLVPASRYRGGIEFSVRYLWKKFKPNKESFRVCPDYI